MYPAYLIRAAIDWVRHNEEYKDSNPYSRCEATVATCQDLWREQFGKINEHLVEPAAVAAYWAEFFHAEDPLADESEWRDGLVKRSAQYDSFDKWQDWFKKQYEKVYKDDNIWLGVLMTSWAHTHQFEVAFIEDSWEFQPATAYLPTSEMWRLEPHMSTVAEVLKELWLKELKCYEDMGFTIDQQSIPNFGKVEGLGFDTKKWWVVWVPRAHKEREALELGDMVADLIAPQGDEWYRRLDNVVFADDYFDATALINRANYVFASRRRLYELGVDKSKDEAILQATAEGWLVPSPERALI